MSAISSQGTEAIARVRAYLSAMEARELGAASAMLAPGFAMVFPGANRFTEVADLVAWARPRYRFVRKNYSRFDAAPAEDGTAVTCFGTLEGEWPDGTAFSGIRFCDWFLVGADGRLLRQEVWNDLAEAGRSPKHPWATWSPARYDRACVPAWRNWQTQRT